MIYLSIFIINSLINSSYQISKADLKVKFKYKNNTQLTIANYEALYDIYDYQLTVNEKENAENVALLAFQNTIFAVLNKYLNLKLVLTLVGVYFSALVFLVALKPIKLYYLAWQRRSKVQKVLKNKKNLLGNRENLIEYLEFCTKLNEKKIEPLPTYKIYRKWIADFKKAEVDFILKQENDKIFIY
jgi:hypothetical protein